VHGQRGARTPTWIGRLTLLVAAALLAAVALEIAAPLVYRAYRHRPFVRAEVQARLLAPRLGPAPLADSLAPELRERLEAVRDANVPDAPVIIHPYFGFVANPQGPGVNAYGFFESPPLVNPADDTVTIAIFGGSLADQVFYLAKDALADALRRRPQLAGRRIEVVSTALGGYKQPQQLNVLSFLLARGAAYDVVVNLDGFNEIDASLENLADGVNPFFPYNWKLHVRRGLDVAAMTQLARIDLIRERRGQLRRAFGHPLLARSAFALTLWDALDRRQEGRLREGVQALEDALGDGGLGPRVRGPHLTYGSEAALYRGLADLWERASLQMWAACTAHGVGYVHALQPNQYLPDSKRLTEEELRAAYRDDFPAADRIPRGYPLLIERGRRLQARGVRFVDLTQIFADEARTVYTDVCCHVNPFGARMIAERLADAIVAEISQRGSVDVEPSALTVPALPPRGDFWPRGG
jgi:hypothetical protein